LLVSESCVGKDCGECAIIEGIRVRNLPVDHGIFSYTHTHTHIFLLVSESCVGKDCGECAIIGGIRVRNLPVDHDIFSPLSMSRLTAHTSHIS
jgi:bacterioferritin-associated ferredoxin